MTAEDAVARACDECGEPQSDSWQLSCEYCGSPLPASKATDSALDPGLDQDVSSFATGDEGDPLEGDLDDDVAWPDERHGSAGDQRVHSRGAGRTPSDDGSAGRAPGGAEGQEHGPLRLRVESPEKLIDVPPEGRVLLGRRPDSPIHDHQAVTRYISSQHVEVWRDPKDDLRLLVEDLGSTNGTWLNGARLLPHVVTQVEIGATIRLAGEYPVRIEVIR